VTRVESHMKKNRWVSIGARTLLTIAIIGIAAGITRGLIATKEEAKRVSAPPPPRLVQTILASSRSIPRSWISYGTARALRSAEIASEVSGVVLERPHSIEPGVTVKRGELLVRLDAHDYQQMAVRAREAIAGLDAQIAGLEVERRSFVTRVELAEESVLLAREELRAAQTATAGSGVGEIEVNRQRRALIVLDRDAEVQKEFLAQIPHRRAAIAAQIELERANLRLAERDIERCSITARFAGTLQRIDVREGERVSTGAAIARLVDLREIEIPLHAPLSASSSIRVGDRVWLKPSGEDSASWEGRVARIAPEAESSSRTITVFAVVEQEIGRAHV